MKTFITIILFVTNVVVSLAQAVDTTIFVCRNDTLHLTNTQFLGSTLRQNGVIYVVDSATCDYSTIPEDYVFDPPYDTLPHSETYILKFDSIEEVDDARTALDGYKWKLAMWDLDQHLRSELKYNENISGETDAAYDAVREKIREILESYNLNLE